MTTQGWRILSLLIGIYLVPAASSKNRDLRRCGSVVQSSVCSSTGLPYTSARFPNEFNHPDVRTAEDVLLGEYLPLFNSECSEYIRPFVCSVFFPECPKRRRDKSLRPCKELCEKARENCKPTFESYGQTWPEQLDCERFEPHKPKRSRKKGRDNCFNYLPPPPDFCKLPADIGPCNRLTGKFFYDEKSQICRSFTYGGCAGNDNRFETKEECDSVCMRKGTDVTNNLQKPVTRPPVHKQNGHREKTVHVHYTSTITSKPPLADWIPTMPPSIPPMIVNPPGNHLVKEFESVTLTCQASGPPPIEYSWNRLDGPMPEEKIIKEEVFGDEGILVISNMTRDDAGEYLCTAENFEGIVDSVAVVTIYADVKIIPFQNVINVAQNEHLQFICSATGHPQPTIIWRKRSFPDVIISTKNVLIIEAAHSDDIGTYVCEASNKYSAASRDVQVVVSVPIWVGIEKSVYLKYGETSSIECILEGYPAIDVKWFNEYRNISISNEKFTTREVYLLDKNIYRVTSHLFFHNVTDMDAGKYSCYGTNNAGIFHGSTTVLVTGENCAFPEKAENGKFEVENRYQHGSKITYACNQGYTMVGESSIYCINGNYNNKSPNCYADCQVESNPHGTHGYLTHGSTGKLQCHENLGYYLGKIPNVTCKDGNIVGDADCYKPPSFQERPVDSYVIENQDIILKCIPDTNDTVVTWYRGEKEVLLEENISKITTGRNGSVLVVKQASFDDGGSYTCKISNEIGTATANARISVIGEDHIPRIIKPLANVVEHVGQNVQLRCENKGNPIPNVTWFYESQPITSERMGMLVVDSTLLISRIEARHSGKYTCVATNRYGSVSANCTLTVIDPPTKPPPQPELIEYMKDPNSQLRALLMCPYGGKAEEAVNWKFGDADLTSTLRHYTVTNRRLIIHDANESDNGVYTCTVRTTKGVQVFKTILTITPSDSVSFGGYLLSSGEEDVLSDSGITNQHSKQTMPSSVDFRATTITTTLEKESVKNNLSISDSPGKVKELVNTGPCAACFDSLPKIKPRRSDINDTGIPHYFRGWVDVQGQGAANDYCRLIHPSPTQLMLACALAGTQGESEYNYVSTSNLDPGYKETSYMKDEDGDGRDDYCRCVGAGRLMYVWCMQATEDGFAGNTEGAKDGTEPSQYTFVAPGSQSILRKCKKRKVDPFFGLPV